jgi:PIN domain nuclease of toxin-antitoxin system
LRLLLDTHLAVWLVTEPERIPRRAHDLLMEPSNQVFGSAVAVWEVAIKHSKRVREGQSGIVSGQELLDELGRAGLPLLSVTAEHAAMLDHLPPVHNDPFDRLLVAQAQAEPMRLLTVDTVLGAYGAAVLVV